VRGLRPDGYHELSTVLQSVSLHDELVVEKANAGFELLVEPEGTDVGPEEENTVLRARNALRALTDEELPARVRVRKRIPAGAGLGGGSADAAAALRAFDALFGLGLGDKELLRVGLEVGADVPFCLLGGTALAEGVGEVLSLLPAPPPHEIVLAKPAAGAETARIFRAYDDASGAGMAGAVAGSGGASSSAVMEALHAGDLSALAGGIGNELGGITEGLLPEVRELRDELVGRGALGASMTGSGTGVFGLFGPGDGARRAALEMGAPFVARCAPVGRGVEEI